MKFYAENLREGQKNQYIFKKKGSKARNSLRYSLEKCHTVRDFITEKSWKIYS